MKDKFVTPDFELDLSRLKIRWTEKNPWFQDQFSCLFSFPFEVYLTSNLKKHIGNYPSLHATGLKKIHLGYLVWEGRISSAKMEVLEVQAERLRVQIRSGLDRFPNFDKKLKELPFKRILVPDIFEHAEQTVRKKYPQTHYNFPKVIYDKHEDEARETDSCWANFNGFLNDRDAKGIVKSPTFELTKNIIHPMPYLLHILKTGFLDAGYELTGHIVQDEDFKQRVVYTPVVYHNTSDQKEQVLIIAGSDYDHLTDTRAYSSAVYKKTFLINAPGHYRLKGTISIGDESLPIPHAYSINIKRNDRLIFNTAGSATSKKIDLNLVIHANQSENNQLEIIMEVPIKEPVLSIPLLVIAQHREDATIIPEIIQLNEVDLKHWVPDMTFGNLVTIIKNWKNYDLEIRGKQVWMNLLPIAVTDYRKDIRVFEVKKPKRVFFHKRSYLLAFPDMDKLEDKIDTIYIDENGVQLNGTPKEDTHKIIINAYCLPLGKYRGRQGARIKKETNDMLGLINYCGLIKGDNVPTNPPGLLPPEIINRWKKWFNMRIESIGIEWTFQVNKNHWRDKTMRHTFYAYGKKLWVTEWTKRSLNERTYEIQIKTETIS